MPLDGAQPRTLRGRVDSTIRAQVEGSIASIAGMFDRDVAEVLVAAAAEAGNVRRLSIRVVDRLKEPWPACWPVRLWISTTAGGPPSGAQTLAVITGTLAATLAANQYIELVTDATGLAVVDLGVTGAGTRYVRGFVVGVPDDGGAGAVVFA